MSTRYARDFSTDADKQRLGWQMDKVLGYLASTAIRERDRWLTIEEMRIYLEAQWKCRFPEASLSAQVRNLRKSEFGGFDILSRRREGGRIAEYRYIGKRSQSAQPPLFDYARGEQLSGG